MKNWNYRVIKIQDENGIHFTLAEVYYDENDCPSGWIVCNNTLIWSKYENLKGTVGLLSKAFELPTLTVDGDKLK